LRQRRRNLECGEHAEFLRSLLYVLSIELENITRAIQGKEEESGDDILHRVQLIFERRDDSEVPPASLQCPEKILVLLLACDKETSVCGNHVSRYQVVARETKCSREISNAATKRESGDSSRCDDAARGRHAECVGRVIESAPGDATFGTNGSSLRIDADAIHRREINDHATIVCAKARHAVGTAPDRKILSLLASKLDRCHHIRGIGASHDHGGPPIDHPVVDFSSVLIRSIARHYRLTIHMSAEFFKSRHSIPLFFRPTVSQIPEDVQLGNEGTVPSVPKFVSAAHC
jgi:hypothetical protein